MEIKYLKWLSSSTCTTWWCDTANPYEIKEGIENGAVGITMNPVLASASLAAVGDYWKPVLASVPKNLSKNERTVEILKRLTQECARLMEGVYNRTQGKHGYVCAQVNPRKPGDSALMLDMAKMYSKWAPNIAVKLPVTAAGLEVLEECAALGITVTATVSFTVPQVLAVAERYQKGVERARRAGVKPGRCFAVVMVGRIDDYIRDVAQDGKANVGESDIIQCGTAIVKRAYSIFKEKGYEAVLMAAGMRGAYHAADLAGGDLVLSIHPKIQKLIYELAEPYEEKINIPVDPKVIDRLMSIPEFVRSYEPDVMKPSEFITFGAVQKTLSQFAETGWNAIEKYEL